MRHKGIEYELKEVNDEDCSGCAFENTFECIANGGKRFDGCTTDQQAYIWVETKREIEEIK